MKRFIKIIAMLIFCALMFANILPVSAETTTVAGNTTAEEKTTERETTPAEEKTTEEKTTEEKTTTDKNDDEISVTFENGKVNTQYVYTGKVITPKLTIRKEDGSIASPDEYSVEYMSDSKSTGAHHVTVTYLKSGYKAMCRYDIVPGTTDKINVKVKDGKVTVSWNPVPGAGVYRVYKYDEAKNMYIEMYWSDGEIASASTTRTFTKDELKPGGKYKMAIMALPAINWMPTDQMAYFTVDTAKDTDASQKPVTTEKTTLITPQPTKAGATLPKIELTTVKESENTTEEKITVEKNTTGEIENTTGTISHAQANSDSEEEEKTPVDRTKLVLIICVSLLAIVGIVFTVYKKKK